MPALTRKHSAIELPAEQTPGFSSSQMGHESAAQLPLLSPEQSAVSVPTAQPQLRSSQTPFPVISTSMPFIHLVQVGGGGGGGDTHD